MILCIIGIGYVDNQTQHIQHQVQNISKALSRYRNYLHSYYQDRMKLQDDKLSIAPSSKFINLALVKKDSCAAPKTQPRDNSTTLCDTTKFVSLIAMEDIVQQDSKFVLVEGVSGMGKSTLCWQLCREWDSLQSLKGYQIVLQLKLREKRIQSVTSLREVFYHYDQELSKSVAEEVLHCEGQGVLFIMDRFDEMPSSLPEDSLIMMLIRGECLPAATCLLTTRPSVLHRQKIFPNDVRRIVHVIHGFSDECKVSFAEVAFKSQPEVARHFKEFILSNPIISSLMSIPVNCAIVAQVYKDITKSAKLMPKSMTHLYTSLISVRIKRRMIEKGIWHDESAVPNLHNLPVEVAAPFERVSRIARIGCRKEDVQLDFTEVDVGENFEHLGLLSETKELYVCEGAKSTYSFLHLSIQEFLAAWHLSGDPEFAGILFADMFQSSSSVRPGRMAFALFLAGLMGADKFGHINDQAFLATCLFEAQDCSILEKQDTSFGKYQIAPKNQIEMYAFGYVLANVSIQWHLAYYNLVSLDVLRNSLCDHAHSDTEIKGSIVGLRICSLFDSDCSLSSLLFLLPSLLYFSLHFTENLTGYTVSHHIVSHLKSVTKVSFFNVYCEDDHLICQSLKHLSSLKVLHFDVTCVSTKGIDALCDAISSSQSLERVELMYDDEHITKIAVIPTSLNEWSHPQCSELDKLVLAALSCPSLKSIETNIPFFHWHKICRVEHVVFKFSLEAVKCFQETILNCLLSLAEMCGVPSVKSLVINCSPNTNNVLFRLFSNFPACHTLYSYKWYCNFISILNDSLHKNASIIGLHLDPHFFGCYAGGLPGALYRNPAIAKCDIARSLSLPELLEHFPSEDSCNSSSANDNYINHTSLKCASSSPDLCLLQSMHNMHPLLYKTSRCSQHPISASGHVRLFEFFKLYHTNDCSCWFSPTLSGYTIYK